MRAYQAVLLLIHQLAIVDADETSYDQNAICNSDQLMRWFNSETGLWYNNEGGPYWWQGANMLTTISEFALLDGGSNDNIMSAIASVYQNAGNNRPFAIVDPGNTLRKLYVNTTAYTDTKSHRHTRREGSQYLNNFYDDEGWWGLGWLAAYDVTSDSNHLNEAIAIWGDMHAAWGNTPCGGIPWNKDEGSPAVAISNELYVHLSAEIALRVGSDQKNTYLDPAIDAWNWFKNSGMINGDGLVNDGLNLDTCENNGEPTYTYNQGVILSGLVALNKATNDNSYLDAAAGIANPAIQTLVDSNGILADSCDIEKQCSGDGEQFKGPFMRGLRDLFLQTRTETFGAFLTKNAQSVWKNDLSIENGGCFNGAYWSGPYATADASTQSVALDALVGALAATT